MWRPSATSATEPKSSPAAISATIIAEARPTTIQVLRSFW
jgi:hypothetical protein